MMRDRLTEHPQEGATVGQGRHEHGSGPGDASDNTPDRAVSEMASAAGWALEHKDGIRYVAMGQRRWAIGRVGQEISQAPLDALGYAFAHTMLDAVVTDSITRGRALHSTRTPDAHTDELQVELAVCVMPTVDSQGAWAFWAFCVDEPLVMGWGESAEAAVLHLKDNAAACWALDVSAIRVREVVTR